MRIKSLISVATGAALLSFAPVFVKLANVGPNAAGFYRMLFGFVGLAVVTLVRRERPWRLGPPLWVGVAAGVLFALDLTCWHRSVYAVGPGFATLLANFQVFVVAAFGVVVLRERLSWRLAVGVPAAVAGVSLLVAPHWTVLPPSYKVGVAFGLVAALCYSGYLLTLRRAGTTVKGSPFAVMTVVTGASLVTFSALVAIQGERLALPAPRDFIYLAAYGLSAQGVAWVLVYKGLAHAPASRAGLVLLLQPALAFVWDVAFFSRTMGWYDVGGLTLALGAIYLGATASPEVT